MVNRIILMFLAAWATMGATPIAEVVCEPRAALLKRLSAQGPLQTAGSGLRDPETVIEVWVTSDGRWRLVQAQADGTACLLAMGDHWMAPMPLPPA